MSHREKRLLIFFALAGFLILNLLGYKFYTSMLLDAKAANAKAKTQMQSAEVTSRSRDEVAAAMKWLDANLPRPADYQTVQSSLQKLAETEANSAGLTIRAQKPIDTKETMLPPPGSPTGTQAASPQVQLERVKVQLALSGTEQSLYRWINSLTVPDKIRSVTRLLLTPNKEDLSKIDCTADVEQWFTPATPES